MQQAVKLVKKLLGWTTLYTVGDAAKFDPPQAILRALGKKTWFTTNSRKYYFRFFLYFIYYIAIGIITYLGVQGRSNSIKILALTGGLYMWLTLVILMVRFFYYVVTSQSKERKSEKPGVRLDFILVSPILFAYVWIFSAFVYFLFFSPLFLVAVMILNTIFSFDFSILLAATLSHSAVSLLQYWSRRPVRK